MNGRDRFAHSTWLAATSTGLGYVVVLAVLFVALFLVPFLLFRALGVAG